MDVLGGMRCWEPQLETSGFESPQLNMLGLKKLSRGGIQMEADRLVLSGEEHPQKNDIPRTMLCGGGVLFTFSICCTTNVAVRRGWIMYLLDYVPCPRRQGLEALIGII